jgi:hypothetical protein
VEACVSTLVYADSLSQPGLYWNGATPMIARVTSPAQPQWRKVFPPEFAVRESGHGPKRRFMASQQDVGNGGQTGRSADKACTAAAEPTRKSSMHSARPTPVRSSGVGSRSVRTMVYRRRRPWWVAQAQCFLHERLTSVEQAFDRSRNCVPLAFLAIVGC